MSRPKVLYASSSVGLGHATRDCYLSSYLNWADIEWLSAGQALKYITYRGYDVIDISYDLISMDKLLEPIFKDGWLRIDLGDARKIYNSVRENAIKIIEAVDFGKYDLIIADEFWELLFMSHMDAKKVFITDFTSFKPSGRSILQRIMLPLFNRMIMKRLASFDLRIYVGFDWRNDKGFEYYGQIFTHDNFVDDTGEDHILVNIGGTELAKPILDMIMPVLDSIDIDYRVIGGIDHFNPNPLRDIANAKLIITLGGYSSLLELARFRKRGIIIPLGDHFEQEGNAMNFIDRRGYRVLLLRKLKPGTLIKYISEVLKEDPDPPRFRDGSKEIAKRIKELLKP